MGFVFSPEKCQWEPGQQFTWCGFDWDTKEFSVAVTIDKKSRIKLMSRELLGSRVILVRVMAALTGLIISTAPAVGRNARVYTRVSVGWCQELVDMDGWGAKGELTATVEEELLFWVERLDEFSSQPIRKAAGVLEYECARSDPYSNLINLWIEM